jgi:hypothetical protein
MFFSYREEAVSKVSCYPFAFFDKKSEGKGKAAFVTAPFLWNKQ